MDAPSSASGKCQSSRRYSGASLHTGSRLRFDALDCDYVLLDLLDRHRSHPLICGHRLGLSSRLEEGLGVRVQSWEAGNTERWRSASSKKHISIPLCSWLASWMGSWIQNWKQRGFGIKTRARDELQSTSLTDAHPGLDGRMISSAGDVLVEMR